MSCSYTKASATSELTLTQPATKDQADAGQTVRKLYLLDTNVLLHDPTALFRFEEHDICIPLVVLEELDRHKKGVSDLARSARQVNRVLADLMDAGSMAEGFSLEGVSTGAATGRLFFKEVSSVDKGTGLGTGLDADKADNQILACAKQELDAKVPVVLVTKDINLRVKALAHDIPAQDYRSDRVLLSDSDVLPPGYLEVDEDFWTSGAAGSLSEEEAFWRKGNKQYAKVSMPLPVNFFIIENRLSGKPRLWRVESTDGASSTVYVVSSRVSADHLLKPRNAQQAMALSILHDEDLDAVALLGPAGTGKTLMAVAAGLDQVRQGRFKEVLITRATVPLGEDIGFLPGTESDKMGSWLGGTLKDVYAVLGNGESKALLDRVEVASMSFMRGRSFQGKFIIIDEAQNLTIPQMHALLTRVGEGSKIVLTGNLAQIDTPYLDEGSSGLAWAVKTLQGWPHAGHLILTRGERSRLATYIEEVARTQDN